MSVSNVFYASDRCHRQQPGTRRRCNSPQHKIKGLFYPFITVCYRVEQMSFHSAVLQQEQGTLSIHGWVSKQIKKTFNYSSMHNFICFDKPICEGLHFQCGKNCFDHKYRFTLPKINLINSTLRCQDRKSEAINRHLSFTSKCNIFSKGISELPQH